MRNLDRKTLNSTDIGEGTEESVTTLTRTERLILANQYEILAGTEPELREYCEVKIMVLKNGFELEYESLFDEIESETLSREDCKLVSDRLYLERRLGEFFLKNPECSLSSLPGAEYQGFDGQEEAKYKKYASFKMKNSLSPEYWEKKNLDSHSPSLEVHKKMVSRWRDLGHRRDLSLKEVESILLDT